MTGQEVTNAETRDYSALEARELDALVAERVMGQSVTLIGSHPHYMEDSTVYRAVRHYSTDPAAAFTVLEAMRGRGYSVDTGAYQRASYWKAHVHKYEARLCGKADADSMPRAVCIAALRAVEAGA